VAVIVVLFLGEIVRVSFHIDQEFRLASRIDGATTQEPSFPAPTIDCFYLFADVLPRDALASHGDSCCHTGKLTPLFRRSAITPW
jgi:hypothetical protein